MEPINFMQYERISDDLYFLSKNVVLRFNVALASYNKDGKRVFFHKEYLYEKDSNNVVSIKRNYDFYVSLENLSPDQKEFIMIRAKDFPKFKNAIHVAADWFRDKKYSKLFATTKGKLILTSPIPTCEINSLSQGKYIKIEPTIITLGFASDDNIPGICITLSDPNNYVNLNVDTLIGLEYVVDCINMIQMAQTMIASIPMEAINRYDINNNTQIQNKVTSMQARRSTIADRSASGINGIEGRFIGKPKLEGL